MDQKLLFFLLVYGICLFVCPGLIFGQERLVSYQGVSVRVDFLGGEEKFSIKKVGEVLKNLVYFESEVLGNSQIGQSASLYKIEIKTESPSPVLSIDIQTTFGKNFSFLMKNLDMNEEGFLRSFRLKFLNEPKEYSILNTQIDEKGDILERVLILTRSLSAPWILQKCEEFVEGICCVYSQYLDHHFTAYEIKTFLLDIYGIRRFFRTRDGILDRVNSRKIMEREIQEKFSSEPHSPFKIVNVQMESYGRISFLELMDSPYFEKESFRETLHIDIHFLKYHGFGALEKLMRLYQWKQGKKFFLSGQLSENFLTRDVRVKQMKDTWFDILPDREGLSPEERILQRAHYFFPLQPQKNMKTENHSQSSFEEGERRYCIGFKPFVLDGKIERKPIFESIRDVRYLYLDSKKEKTHKIYVDYFSISPEEKKLQKTRTLILELLKVSTGGHPLDLMIKMISATGEFHEEHITSDCRYVIEQAVEGDMFVLKEKNPNPVVCLADFSPEGQIHEAWVYTLETNTSPPVIKKAEKISGVQ